MLQLPEPDWRPGSPGSSSTAQTQCVSCGDIPALSPPGLRILVLAGKFIQLSGPVLGHHFSSGQGLPMMGQMPGQQAPIHFSPGPQCHGLQRHVGTVAPCTAHLCRAQHGDTSGSTVWETHWSPWMLGARNRVWFLCGLSWMLYLEEARTEPGEEQD